MGNEMFCPCSNPDLELNKNGNNCRDNDSDIYKLKLTLKQLIYHYEFQTCKAYLLKTDQLEDFFANRNFLIYSYKKNSKSYFNQVFVSNFIASSDDSVFVIMKYDESFETLPFDSNVYAKLSKQYAEHTGKYTIETIEISDSDDKLVNEITYNLNSISNKSFHFVGIIKENSNKKKQYKIVYKYNFSVDEYHYSVGILLEQLSQENIMKVIDRKEFKGKQLKSIFQSNLNERNNTYFFIFEENLKKTNINFDYMVLEIPKTQESNSDYIDEITRRVNNVQGAAYSISCIFSDINTAFVIFISEEEI